MLHRMFDGQYQPDLGSTPRSEEAPGGFDPAVADREREPACVFHSQRSPLQSACSSGVPAESGGRGVDRRAGVISRR